MTATSWRWNPSSAQSHAPTRPVFLQPCSRLRLQRASRRPQRARTSVCTTRAGVRLADFGVRWRAIYSQPIRGKIVCKMDVRMIPPLNLACAFSQNCCCCSHSVARRSYRRRVGSVGSSETPIFKPCAEPTLVVEAASVASSAIQTCKPSVGRLQAAAVVSADS